MNEQKNIIIAFTEKTDFFLSNIEKKYNLEESDEEAIEKMEQDRPLRINIIVELARDFVKKIISEKELIVSLQKDLTVSQETAEKISKNIINDLIPSFRKIPEGKLNEYSFNNKEEQNKKENMFFTVKPQMSIPIGVEKILKEKGRFVKEPKKPIEELKKIKEEKQKEYTKNAIKKPDNLNKPSAETEKGVKKQNDPYREAVE